MVCNIYVIPLNSTTVVRPQGDFSLEWDLHSGKNLFDHMLWSDAVKHSRNCRELAAILHAPFVPGTSNREPVWVHLFRSKVYQRRSDVVERMKRRETSASVSFRIT